MRAKGQWKGLPRLWPGQLGNRNRPSTALPDSGQDSLPLKAKDHRLGRPAGRTGRTVTAPVVPLRPGSDVAAAAAESFAVVSRHLDRCKLAARTVRAYKRQAAAYAAWLAANASAHGRATKSATPRWPAALATWSQRGWTCAAATPDQSGPGSAARSPSPAYPRPCSPPATTPASLTCAFIAPVTLLPPSCQGGADPAQVQALLGQASIDTAARYFRAGSAENAEVAERVFSD
jgi:hypothetical protein